MGAVVQYFSFPGLCRPVCFIDCELLYPHLFEILRDWKIEKVGADGKINPDIIVKKTASGFERRSKWLTKSSIFKDPVDSVCDLIVDLSRAYVSDNSHLLCLHCAALKFPEGLVVFPNTYRAGKSIMSLNLVYKGARLYTDDVLPILDDGGSGMALGILPRLRRPLPEQVNPEFVDFIQHRSGPGNSRYLYVNMTPEEQASLGEKSGIKGIVILQREQNAAPELSKTKKSTVIKDMVMRNFARQPPGLEILDRIYSIVDKAECYKLMYDDLDIAADLIVAEFG